MGCARPNVARSDPYSLAQLDPVLRDRLHTAIIDCPYRLTLVSGYRDAGRQWDLRRERCPGRECNFAACRGYPQTAAPYASDHQRRTAADMGGTGLSWLIAHREAYGLALTVKSENWHFSANRKDVRTGRTHNRPTVRILKYGQKTTAATPAVAKPAPKPKPPVLKLGAKGVAVTVLKQSLNAVNRVYLGRPKNLSGTDKFDNDTKAMLVAFQRFYNSMAALSGLKIQVPLTGELDDRTSSALSTWSTLSRERMAEETLRPGDKGLGVVWLQRALNVWAKANGKKTKLAETGLFDAATKNLVIEFKEWHNKFLAVFVNKKPGGVGSMVISPDVGPRAKDSLAAWVKEIQKKK